MIIVPIRHNYYCRAAAFIFGPRDYYPGTNAWNGPIRERFESIVSFRFVSFFCFFVLTTRERNTSILCINTYFLSFRLRLYRISIYIVIVLDSVYYVIFYNLVGKKNFIRNWSLFFCSTYIGKTTEKSHENCIILTNLMIYIIYIFYQIFHIS